LPGQPFPVRHSFQPDAGCFLHLTRSLRTIVRTPSADFSNPSRWRSFLLAVDPSRSPGLHIG
jgi:hypothetical protein